MAKKPLILLPADQMKRLITEIEQKLPGYWYSVAQTSEQNIRVSVGASKFCMLDLDRAWAETETGDRGILFDIPYVRDEVLTMDILTKVTPLFEAIEKIRKLVMESGTTIPPYVGPHRRQSKDDLRKFRRQYTQFLGEYETFKNAGIILSEVYIGSCQLTVDVSLRGVTKYGKRFEFTHDYPDDAILANSLEAAVTELKSELLREKV